MEEAARLWPQLEDMVFPVADQDAMVEMIQGEEGSDDNYYDGYCDNGTVGGTCTCTCTCVHVHICSWAAPLIFCACKMYGITVLVVHV